MKICVFETRQWEHAACQALSAGHDLVCWQQTLDTHTTAQAADAEIVTTFVHSRLTADVLRRLPRLRLIATRSTGCDHIDLDYTASHGITVCNVPDYGDHTVAEHVFALLLALARRLVDSVERTRRGDFSQTGRRGFDLRGKTLGVIGTGRIGRCVIGIAKGFGMQVVGFDARPDAPCARQLGFRYDTFEELLRAADVVTLHLPARPDTRHLLADRAFDTMKRGAVLINTSRGSVVDPAALVRALADGRIGAAGLDVLPEEPLLRDEAEVFRMDAEAAQPDLRALVADHALLRFPNVIVTPHVAFNTQEALQRILETTLSNIDAFAAGEPINVVNAH